MVTSIQALVQEHGALKHRTLTSFSRFKKTFPAFTLASDIQEQSKIKEICWPGCDRVETWRLQSSH